MRRLKFKLLLSVLSVIIAVVLFQGCDKAVLLNPYDMADFGFIESEQVVEVDADTKSFRIVGEWTEGDLFYELPRWPGVYLDTINTTALDIVHFIHHVDPVRGTIGAFTPLDSNKTYREREVKLLPENIKSEIIIHYCISGSGTGLNIHNLVKKHKVILRPKINNEKIKK